MKARDWQSSIMFLCIWMPTGRGERRCLGVVNLRIYMDVCCLNRPFDDLSPQLVYMEADAVMTIVSLCEQGEWILLSSDIIDYELSQTPDNDKLKKIEDFYSVASNHLSLSLEIEKRAKHFQRFGVKLYDSYHLATAEIGNADALPNVLRAPAASMGGLF
jgi:hypothetical protein